MFMYVRHSGVNSIEARTLYIRLTIYIIRFRSHPSQLFKPESFYHKAIFNNDRLPFLYPAKKIDVISFF